MVKGGRSQKMVNRDGRGKRRPEENTLSSPANRKPIQNLPPQKHPHPLHLFCHDKQQTFCTSDGQTYLRNIPELRDNVVMDCCDDWLVLWSRSDKSRYSLWNTQTFESIHLPPLKSKHKFDIGSCVFSSSMVLLFDRMRPIIAYFLFGRDHNEWREIRFCKKQIIHKGCGEIDRFSYSACCNGVIYVATFCQSKLFRVDINELDSDEIFLRPLETRLPSGGRYTTPRVERRLVESAGEILTINLFLGGIRWTEVIGVEIHRLILSSNEWVKVESCNDRNFFLGESSSFSCPSPSEVEGGRVYFYLPDDNRKLYSYNIDGRSISVAFCHPKLPLPRTKPVWILQRHEEEPEDEIFKEEIQEDVAEVSSESYDEDCKLHNLLHLPPEILETIAKKLVLLNYMSFRAVSRRFWLAAPPIQWRKASLAADSLSPWFIFTGKDREVYNLMDPGHNSKYVIKIPAELKDATIHYSKDGWLLMSRDQEDVFFFNPFTKVVLSWPKHENKCIPAFSFIFSSVPTSSECSIIGISPSKGEVTIYVIRSGDEDWTRLDFTSEIEFVPLHTTPVSWKGGFYFMSQKGHLGVLTVEECAYDWQPLHNLQVPCNAFHQIFLVKCNEELLSIFIGDFGKWVQVFRLDQADLAWKEVHSLGDHTIQGRI